MCQNPNYYKIISYLCSAKSGNHISWPIKHDFEDALIVQRIERGFPKPKIWVRFPVGVLTCDNVKVLLTTPFLIIEIAPPLYNGEAIIL